MAAKKLVYMVVDTETATLPFADSIAMADAEKKKRIAIARPLVYDIGWTLMYRDGTVFEKKHFLIAETFSVPSVFNTAYYKEKRPLYLDMMKRGEISVLPWETVMEEFVEDLAVADYVGAFNSMFDFKKAIPFTELYISKLYSPDYYEWEKMQYGLCEKIAANVKPKSKPDFDPEHFTFRNNHYEMFDIWGMACETLINKVKFKQECLENRMLSNSGDFFKTSAEATYRYLIDKYDFDEAHTALEDAEIESFILSKILAKKAVTVGIDYFPFRKLGKTTDFVKNHAKGKKQAQYARTVHSVMDDYVGDYDTEEELTNYKKQILGRMEILKSFF